MRILVVEDDETLGAGLLAFLKQEGYDVDLLDNGLQADASLAHEAYDLVVLDLGLPGLDGFEVLRRARRRESHVPILLLTARDGVEDRVRGLDIGADDYLVKPFEMRELAARIRALVRRGQQGADSLIRIGQLTLDPVARRVWIDDRPLRLTGREWALMEFLVLRAGRIVSKDQIAAAVGSGKSEISPNVVEVYISRLRAKLQDTDLKIHSIRGFGYYLEKSAADAD